MNQLVKSLYQKLSIILLSAILLVSCTKQDVNGNTSDSNGSDISIGKLHFISSKVLQSTSLKLSLYRQYDSLFVGYNPLFFKLEDTATQQVIRNAQINIHPEMNMISSKHSCPVDQPVFADSSQLYQGAATFIMASMDDMQMSWSLPISVAVDNAVFADTFAINNVKNTASDISFLRAFKVSTTGKQYYLTLVHPWQSEQIVGINNLEIAIYQMQDKDNFLAVDGLNVSFIPTMPSMGHSSTNNVNPTSTGKAGHYAGAVNFTMTGDWQLDFTVSDGLQILAKDIYINFYF